MPGRFLGRYVPAPGGHESSEFGRYPAIRDHPGLPGRRGPRTASPLIQGAGLATLEDPDGYFLASNVVPLASDRIDDDAAAIINRVSAAMTPEGLVALNAQSVDEQASAAAVAAGWLAENDVSGRS